LIRPQHLLADWYSVGVSKVPAAPLSWRTFAVHVGLQIAREFPGGIDLPALAWRQCVD